MTDPIHWKDEYSVGVDVLDRQHKGLIKLINRLTSEDADIGMMAWVFDELEAYTKDHFSEEERLMAEAGYPDLATHRKQHHDFEQWLSAVRQTYSIGAASPSLLAETVNAFLADWLVNHILSSDMAYRSALSESGRKEQQEK